jgi:hypothetical protein
VLNRPARARCGTPRRRHRIDLLNLAWLPAEKASGRVPAMVSSPAGDQDHGLPGGRHLSGGSTLPTGSATTMSTWERAANRSSSRRFPDRRGLIEIHLDAPDGSPLVLAPSRTPATSSDINRLLRESNGQWARRRSALVRTGRKRAPPVTQEKEHHHRGSSSTGVDPTGGRSRSTYARCLLPEEKTA